MWYSLAARGGAVCDFGDAGAAIRREHSQTSRTRRLRCREVEFVSREHDEKVYRLSVGRQVSIDWTWEGASAFRPWDIDDPESEADGDLGWDGDVVGLEQDDGDLFVCTSGPAPCRGLFFVKPFEFLACLDRLYNDPKLAHHAPLLSERLALASGHAAAEPANLRDGSTAELADIWVYPWSLLWGPPGTGKTYMLARQIAEIVRETKERTLVVSTTNRATDEAAIYVGKALRKLDPDAALRERVMRVGSGADFSRFEAAGFRELLHAQSVEIRRALAQIKKRLDAAASGEERARLATVQKRLKQALQDPSAWAFANPGCRVVVTTAFNALSQLAGSEAGAGAFDNVIVDEAGLISRAAAAALSLLSARRTVLVGDPKQLAPISEIARLLPTDTAAWLAESGLGHLTTGGQQPNAHMLKTQYRMHPEIRQVVSDYQYGGELCDAAEVARRRNDLGDVFLGTAPRAIWYVLDEDDAGYPPNIRADRGPGNRSWVRQRTPAIMEKIFERHPGLRERGGVFLSPFKAQVARARQWLADQDAGNWRACTVHSLQGLEADHVLFDTVNAGSTAWPYDEWKRLINVAISRARELFILFASRHEMQEPYMAALRGMLGPRVLDGRLWRHVQTQVRWRPPRPLDGAPSLVGNQLQRRKEMLAILSAEQQRLCGYKMDGKPRLVRGVAGSGKTVVLGHWLARTVAMDAKKKVWVVYGNVSLRGMLDETIRHAWLQLDLNREFPRRQVKLLHIGHLLETLRQDLGARWQENADPFDYNSRARLLLDWMLRQSRSPTKDCHALFVDEAQDMGPDTLRLLTMLVQPTGAEQTARQVMIFYDNAQNLYGRPTPNWAQLGLDMRGRSTVMKESFRSTRPITELALNVLCFLEPPGNDPDHKELVDRGLIELGQVDGRDWWRVNFNHVAGPDPLFSRFAARQDEIEALADQIRAWIAEEGVKPGDVKVLCNGEDVRKRTVSGLTRGLADLGCRVLEQRSEGFDESEDALVVTTPHSFKGYDSEIVCIPAADAFTSRGNEILAKNLYVAMTRARSLLYVSGTLGGRGKLGDIVVNALAHCLEILTGEARWGVHRLAAPMPNGRPTNPT